MSNAAAMKFFQMVKDTNDLEACVRVLEPKDVRAEFDLAFRLCLLFIHPRAPNLTSLRSAGTMPA